MRVSRTRLGTAEGAPSGSMELVILAVLALVLGLAIHRAGRNAALLARVTVTAGRPELVRGRLPPRLWFDIEDVVQRNPCDVGDIRLEVDRGRARIEASGLGEDAIQQLRNAAAQYPLAQLRAGAKRASRSRQSS